jgi:hypothetical protein
MVRTLALAIGVALLLGAAPRLAQAQGNDKDRAAMARESYDQGKKAYNLGNFEEAITLWKKGYEYKDDPIFLFNIAQAYRQKGDYQKAIFYYKGYLREQPSASNKDDVNARIAELQKLLDAQQNATEAPPKGVGTLKDGQQPPDDKGKTTKNGETPKQDKGKVATLTTNKDNKDDKGTAIVTPPKKDDTNTTTTDTTDTGDTSPRPGKGLKLAGIITGASGVAIVVVGVIFALQASSIQSDLETSTRNGVPWSQELSDKEATGKTDATIGAVAIGVGAAAVIAGGTLFYLGVRKNAKAVEQAHLEVVPAISPKTAGMLVRFSF